MEEKNYILNIPKRSLTVSPGVLERYLYLDKKHKYDRVHRHLISRARDSSIDTMLGMEVLDLADFMGFCENWCPYRVFDQCCLVLGYDYRDPCIVASYINKEEGNL